MSMGEPEVTGSGAEDGGEYDDEVMSTPTKVPFVDRPVGFHCWRRRLSIDVQKCDDKGTLALRTGAVFSWLITGWQFS